MLRLTTLPAPMTDPCPMRTPGRITALLPIHTLSSMSIGSENRPKSARREGWTGCPVVVSVTLGAIMTSSPMRMSTSSTSVRLTLPKKSSPLWTLLPNAAWKGGSNTVRAPTEPNIPTSSDRRRSVRPGGVALYAKI
ncbi:MULTISPECIES: hypothetical protein [unclassified Streptomyces]|uniref:hypothetical protein n=1 Tax=unclassified Streptomyces TaxID=2593676 RepID=UPI0035E3B61E